MSDEINQNGDGVDVYDAEPETYTFRVKEKDQVNEYILMGFQGEGMAQWMSTVARKVKGDKKGVNANTSDFRNFQASLIHLCCYDGARNRVPVSRIAGWSAKLQNILFERCQELNGLNDDAGDKAKKEGKSPSADCST